MERSSGAVHRFGGGGKTQRGAAGLSHQRAESPADGWLVAGWRFRLGGVHQRERGADGGIRRWSASAGFQSDPFSCRRERRDKCGGSEYHRARFGASPRCEQAALGLAGRLCVPCAGRPLCETRETYRRILVSPRQRCEFDDGGVARGVTRRAAEHDSDHARCGANPRWRGFFARWRIHTLAGWRCTGGAVEKERGGCFPSARGEGRRVSGKCGGGGENNNSARHDGAAAGSLAAPAAHRTACGQSTHGRRRGARTEAVSRHATLGEQHAVVRELSCAGQRIRRSAQDEHRRGGTVGKTELDGTFQPRMAVGVLLGWPGEVPAQASADANSGRA